MRQRVGSANDIWVQHRSTNSMLSVDQSAGPVRCTMDSASRDRNHCADDGIAITLVAQLGPIAGRGRAQRDGP